MRPRTETTAGRKSGSAPGADATQEVARLRRQLAMERARTAKALRRGQEQFTRVMHDVPIPVLVYAENGEVIALSRTFARLTGYERRQIRTLEDWLRHGYRDNPAGAEEVRVRLRALFASGSRPPNAERTITTRNGEQRVWLFSDSPPRRLGDGRRYSVAMAVDITERKRLEEDLRCSEAHYHGLLDHLPDVVMRFDRQMRLSYINPAIERYLHPHSGGIQGFNLYELPWPQHRPMFTAILDRLKEVFETGQEATMEFSQPIFSTPRTFHTRLIPEFSAEGRVETVLTIARDISELKEVERTLESRVEARTREAESRARQLQSLAVQLSEAEERERRRLAAFIHDDLQQVLAGAKYQLQSLECDLPEGPRVLARKVGSLIDEAVQRARRLTVELSPPVLHHAGLYPSLEWLAHQMKEQFGLEVELFEVGWEDAAAEPFKTLLFRAVQELLFNVTKHAGVSAARVELSAKADSIQVTVSDEGRGFDPQRQQPADGPGSGFGLINVRERVHSVGGSLRIESRPGRGSRFTLLLPASGREPARPASGRARKQGPVQAAEATACRRLLLVDDHRLVRQGLAAMIGEQPDIRVIGEAAGGREAVELTRALHPDVILMDVSMPEMDGIEATRAIKAEWPGVRVIGLSMFDEPEVAERMREAGAEGFVSKSGSAGEILRAIYDLGAAG